MWAPAMPAAGPNNQVAGLKEALVLGRMLGRTVIVHDVSAGQ